MKIVAKVNADTYLAEIDEKEWRKLQGFDSAYDAKPENGYSLPSTGKEIEISDTFSILQEIKDGKLKESTKKIKQIAEEIVKFSNEIEELRKKC